MRKELVKYIVLIIVSSTLVVLSTGILIKQNTTRIGVNEFSYGFPFGWHGVQQAVYPGAPEVPWVNSWFFLWDWGFWCAIITLIVVLYLMETNVLKN